MVHGRGLRSIYWIRKNQRLMLVLLALVSIGAALATRSLKLNFLYTALLPEKSQLVNEYRIISDHYHSMGHYTVVIESADTDTLQNATESTLSALKKMTKWVKGVNGKIPEAFVTAHGLQLKTLAEQKRVHTMYNRVDIVGFLQSLNNDLENRYVGNEAGIGENELEIVRGLHGVEYLLRTIEEARSAEVTPARVDDVVRDVTVGNPYILSSDRKMTLIFVTPAFKTEDFGPYLGMDNAVALQLQTLQKQFPNARFRRAGLIPQAAAELRALGPQTRLLTAASIVVIFLILSFVFKSFVLAALCVVPLLVGCLWSLAFFALTLESLNILSVMVLVVLIGLGVDYSIHLINRYYHEVEHGIEHALKATFIDTGAGVLSGALTTVAAFLFLMTSETRGVREFGFCAGSGIILFLLANYLILPIVLPWVRIHSKRKVSSGEGRFFSIFGTVSVLSSRFRGIVLPLTLVTIVAAIWAVMHLPFEYDKQKLLPDIEPARTHILIQKRFKMGSDTTSIRVPSVEEAYRIESEFKGQRLIADVDNISRWVSPIGDDDAKKSFIEGWHESLVTTQSKLLNVAFDGNQYVDELQRLLLNLIEIEEMAFLSGRDRITAKTEFLTGGDDGNGFLVRMMKDAHGLRIENQFVQQFATALFGQLKAMTADANKVTLAMVPDAVSQRYRHQAKDEYVVHVFPRYNLNERAPLEAFQKVITGVAPTATGLPQIMLEVRKQNIIDSIEISSACILLVFIVIFLQFRRFWLTLAIILPMVCGCGAVVIVMAWVGLKMNHYNLIAIPLLIGIGVDDGVHFVHHYLKRGHLFEASREVARPLFLTTLTTMIGFGSMGLYPHRGVASLGIVLFLGSFFCFAATLFVAPALMPRPTPASKS